MTSRQLAGAWLAVVLGVTGVAFALRSRGRDLTAAGVAERLARPDPRARRDFAVRLATVHAPATAGVVAARLRIEPDAEVRAALCDALTSARTHEAARALAEALADPAPAVATRARAGLEALYGPSLPPEVDAVRRLVASTAPRG